MVNHMWHYKYRIGLSTALAVRACVFGHLLLKNTDGIVQANRGHGVLYEAINTWY